MSYDNRGTMSQTGSVMRIDNALVEEISSSNRDSGYIVLSYAIPEANGTIFIDLLRLNISRRTVILNSFGLPMCLCDIREDMWIDAVFSPAMTRSIPPQSNAFLIVARREPQSSVTVTTDWIAKIDADNRFLYTGNPYDINSQIRFVVSDSTSVNDRNGNPIDFRSLRSGQMVSITHPDFMTASIPPQTTAYHIQLL